MPVTINVARDFYPFPSGRNAKHGPFNGARFRDELLLPHLKSGEEICVDLSGLDGKTPSFLDEAFGSLVKFGFTEQQLRERLHLVASDDDVVVGETWSYVRLQAQKLARTRLAAAH